MWQDTIEAELVIIGLLVIRVDTDLHSSQSLRARCAHVLLFFATGMKAGKELGVEPVISSKEMSDPEVDHLGVMAYAAWFEHLKPQPPIRAPTPPPPVITRAPTPPPVQSQRNPAEMLSLQAPDRDTTAGNTVILSVMVTSST